MLLRLPSVGTGARYASSSGLIRFRTASRCEEVSTEEGGKPQRQLRLPLQREVRARYLRSRMARAMAAMCAGEDPQHAPTIEAP